MPHGNPQNSKSVFRNFYLRRSGGDIESSKQLSAVVRHLFSAVQAEFPHSHAYRFTPKGYKLALLLIQLRKRIYGPVAFGILRHRPNPQHQPDSSFERAYHKIDTAFDEAVSLLAA